MYFLCHLAHEKYDKIEQRYTQYITIYLYVRGKSMINMIRGDIKIPHSRMTKTCW